MEIRSSKDKEETEYEAPEVDDMGRIRTGALLKKYDEELHGAKTDSFRLGSRGHAKIQVFFLFSVYNSKTNSVCCITGGSSNPGILNFLYNNVHHFQDI